MMKGLGKEKGFYLVTKRRQTFLGRNIPRYGVTMKKALTLDITRVSEARMTTPLPWERPWLTISVIGRTHAVIDRKQHLFCGNSTSGNERIQNQHTTFVGIMPCVYKLLQGIQFYNSVGCSRSKAPKHGNLSKIKLSICSTLLVTEGKNPALNMQSPPLYKDGATAVAALFNMTWVSLQQKNCLDSS